MPIQNNCAVKTWVGLYSSTILMNAIAVALLVGPFLIKKTGKRNLMILSSVGYVVMIALQDIFHKNPVLILVVSFFEQFFGGAGFSDDILLALQNAELRNNIFFYQSLLSLIGAVIVAVLFFFYDLTEKKHANIVRVLRIRTAVDNFNDTVLQDADIPPT